jgi:hypothetical protein
MCLNLGDLIQTVFSSSLWRHDTQQNDIEDNDIQHNGRHDTHHNYHNDIQPNDTQHKQLLCDTQHK